MKIYILCESSQKIGGGWSFIRNLKEGIRRIGEGEIVEDSSQADIVLIPSASMSNRDTVTSLRSIGKKIVLRLDNIPRNSRNRGAGTTRLLDICRLSDQVIYQSVWARNYLLPFLKKDGKVIYNGVDTQVFKSDGGKKEFGKYKEIILYSRYSRDETKGWERAWYRYQMIHRELNGDCKLIIVGRFSDELMRYGFDFYNGEKWDYLGVVMDQVEMAAVMRGCTMLLAPYFNDCYSNTIQEAIACGLKWEVDESGGTPEMLVNGVISIEDMARNYISFFKSI